MNQSFLIKLKTLCKYIIVGLIIYYCTSINILKSQNISTVGEIYDFEIGDIFHYEGEYFSAEIVKSINEIIGKYYSVNNDTIYYIWDFQRASCYIGDTTWNYYSGTETILYTQLDSLIHNGEITNVFSDPNMYNGRLVNVYTPCDCEFLYFVEGCGVAWDYFFDQQSMQTERDMSLVYFKKGEEEWGTPINLYTVIKKVNENSDIYIYPNPVSNNIHIDLASSNTEIDGANIFSITGNLVKTVILENNELNIIDISLLENGVYILELYSLDTKCHRIIIKK